MADPAHTGTTVLQVHDCWALLRSAQVGRLAVSGAEYPDLFPINYLVDRGTVVFRTGEGTKFAAVTACPQVAFEIDGYDPDAGEAWSVIVKGLAEEIKEFYESLEALRLPLSPWHAEPKNRFVRIVPADISGRRFHVQDAAAWRTPMTDARNAAPE